MTTLADLPDLFAGNVQVNLTVENGCWLWIGTCADDRGYAQYRGEYVHRLAYAAVHGPIPDGLVIDHLCRQPSCVRPSHLEAVTQRENLLRGETINARNAAKETCPKGHRAYRTRGDGSRRCVECDRARDRERDRARRRKVKV